MIEKYRREAVEKIPTGYYVLPPSEELKASDLVWDWTSNRFFRADSDKWLFDTFSIPREEIVCAVRWAELTNFKPERRRIFTLRR